MWLYLIKRKVYRKLAKHEVCLVRTEDRDEMVTCCCAGPSGPKEFPVALRRSSYRDFVSLSYKRAAVCKVAYRMIPSMRCNAAIYNIWPVGAAVRGPSAELKVAV